VAVAATLVAVTIAYGQYRLREEAIEEGPRVAILQGNYPSYVDPSRWARLPSNYERALRYLEMMDEAAAKDPDLFLLPETPWRMFLNTEYLNSGAANVRWHQQCYDTLQGRATLYNAYVVTGSIAKVPTPLDLLAEQRLYNSAFVFSPDGEPPQRYDKMHLVLLGEYVPFRAGSLRFLYLWLNRQLPFGGEDFEYSITPGTEVSTFTMTARSQDDRRYGFATPICYENVMPYLSRRFVRGVEGTKRCDFLLNLSNDGWFVHSDELPQHLASSVFRAVENRVGVARAVNTGISCFIDPDGRIRQRVNRHGVVVGPGVDGWEVSRVKVDSRLSLYTRTGDVFALLCAVCWLMSLLDSFALRGWHRVQKRTTA
jgi:apolipoprotein N-acyltransferase